MPGLPVFPLACGLRAYGKAGMMTENELVLLDADETIRVALELVSLLAIMDDEGADGTTVDVAVVNHAVNAVGTSPSALLSLILSQTSLLTAMMDVVGNGSALNVVQALSIDLGQKDEG